MTIRDLVGLVLKHSGKNIEVVYDTSKPAGQPRRNADISKAKEKLGYSPEVNLEDGIKRTIDWYMKNMM